MFTVTSELGQIQLGDQYCNSVKVHVRGGAVCFRTSKKTHLILQVSSLRLCQAVVTMEDKQCDSLVHGNSARLCVELYKGLHLCDTFCVQKMDLFHCGTLYACKWIPVLPFLQAEE